MMQAVKTFLSPTGVIISSFMLFYLCFAGINALHFQERWNFHSHEYQKTLVYYQQPICQDSNVKAKTEGKNKCDEYAVYLSTAAWRRALLDVFESNFVCSGGSCSRWFNHLMLVFLLATLFLGYAFVRHTTWTVQKVSELRNSLPMMFGSSALSSGKVKKYE
jgi:hypothetical protein